MKWKEIDKKIQMLVLSIIVFTGLLVIIDMIISPIYLAFIKNNYQLEDRLVTMVVAISGLMIFLLDYPTSHLADKYGRLKIYIMGLVSTGIGQFIIIFGQIYIVAILGLFIKAFGYSFISGTLRGWFISKVKQLGGNEDVIKYYTSLVVTISRTCMFLALVASQFIVALISIKMVYIVSSLGYIALAIISVLLILIYGDSEPGSNRKESGLVRFFLDSIHSESFRRVALLNVLQSLTFIIYLGLWQLVGIDLEIVDFLPTVLLIGMASSLIYSFFQHRIHDHRNRNRILIALGVIASSVFVFSFLSSPNQKLWFVVGVSAFQILNSINSLIVSEKTYMTCEDFDNSAKYFSLLSSISEITNFVVLILISNVLVGMIENRIIICILIFPTVAIYLYLIKNSRSQNV